MCDLKAGRDIDLELLTNVAPSKDVQQPKTVHFNKILTQINSLLCDVFAAKSNSRLGGGFDNMNDCSV